jgi:hypothetical protein
MRVSKKTVIHPGTVLENGPLVHSCRHVPGTPVSCSSPDRPETAGGTHACRKNCPDCTCRSTDTAEQPRAV